MSQPKFLPSSVDHKAWVRVELLKCFRPFMGVLEKYDLLINACNEMEANEELEREGWQAMVHVDDASIEEESLTYDTKYINEAWELFWKEDHEMTYRESLSEKASKFANGELKRPKPDLSIQIFDKKYPRPRYISGNEGSVSNGIKGVFLPLSLSRGEVQDTIKKYNFSGQQGCSKVDLKELALMKKVMQAEQETDAAATELAKQLHPDLKDKVGALESKRVKYQDLYKKIVNEIIDAPPNYRI